MSSKLSPKVEARFVVEASVEHESQSPMVGAHVVDRVVDTKGCKRLRN